MNLDYASLKARHRVVREAPGYSNALSLRAHRALSWLQRAEREQDDPDAQFIFLWIAFNAAYGQEIEDRSAHPDPLVFKAFLRRLVNADSERLIYSLIWQEFPNSIRLLLDNQYVCREFWEHQNGRLSEEKWKRSFEASKARAHRALAASNTLKVLVVLLDRLYVLRNQLIHGSATWQGSKNRQQVRDGAAIMSKLVPSILHLMLDLGHLVWGEASFPVVD
jgi:hypothetical protein